MSRSPESFAKGRALVGLNAGPRRPTSFVLLGREWELVPGVFAPIYSFSTQLFATWLPYPLGGSFLEIGSGSGVISVHAALSGCARVTALDVSAAAVENTRRNAARHRIDDRVRVLQSDLFDALGADERFDAIFWNSNFVEPPADFAASGELDRTVFDPGYSDHRRFLAEAGAHLTANGRLFLGFSSLGNEERLAELARELGLVYVVTASSRDPGDPDVEYRLLELRPA